jgi:CheY-like chemotaxis protein
MERGSTSAVPNRPQESKGVVLLVDDDRDIVDAIRALLEDDGFDVVTANNGFAALRQLRRAGPRPDVIVLDLMMPLLDGWDFRAEQLADPAVRDIPVIIMTASGLTDGMLDGQLKAAAVLPKPIEVEPFLRVLNDLCRAGACEPEPLLASGGHSR